MNIKFSDLTLRGKLLLIPAFAIIIAVAWFGSAMVYRLFPDAVNSSGTSNLMRFLGPGVAMLCFALSSILREASDRTVRHPQVAPDPHAAERTGLLHRPIPKVPAKIRAGVEPNLKNLVGRLTGFLPNIPDGLTFIELLNLVVLMVRREGGYHFGPMKDFELSRLDSILDEMETECPRWRPFNEAAPGYRVGSGRNRMLPDKKPPRLKSEPMLRDALFGYDRLINGRYSLVRAIGCDANSIVWLGKDIDSNIRKAIKIGSRRAQSDETKTERRSLEIMTQHKHPCFLRIDESFVEEGRLIVIMEFASGGNLYDALEKSNGDGLPVEKLLVYMSHIAEALDYLRKEGVLHRGVQPSSIFLVRGKAKLADSRFALMATEATTSNVALSPYNMAPEIFMADSLAQNDLYSKFKDGSLAKSDLYSLATTYAELRLGRKVFEGRSIAEIAVANGTKMPDLNPLPRAEQKVLLRALAKKPADRFATCSEFIKALEIAVASKTSKGWFFL